MLTTKGIKLDYLKELFTTARLFKESKGNVCNKILKNKVIISAFFEASTRTSISFNIAIQKLGGIVIPYTIDNSSQKKGESEYDTLKTFESYADCIVLRHPQNDFIIKMSKLIKIPIINAGNGDGEHPTQALLDLFTINNYYNLFENNSTINIILIGDVYKSRTISSLICLLSMFSNINITLCPYFENEQYKSQFINKMIELEITKKFNWINIDQFIKEKKSFNVIYMTRFQKERYVDELRGIKIPLKIDSQFIKDLPENSIIMHPLPRNEEIDTSIDNDNRCKIFEQMENGLYIRMALFYSLFK